MRWYFCTARILEARQHKRERKREGTTTYFVDTMEHKCVATGPVDIRQADCSLSLLRPIVGSSGPAEPPAGRALFPDDGLVINDGFAGAAENRETSLTIRDRSRIIHASLFRLAISLNIVQVPRGVMRSKGKEITSFSKIR